MPEAKRLFSEYAQKSAIIQCFRVRLIPTGITKHPWWPEIDGLLYSQPLCLFQGIRGRFPSSKVEDLR